MVGRSSGLKESIGRIMARIAVLSSRSNAANLSSRLGFCMLSSKRSSHDRTVRPFIGLPASVYQCRPASHFLHHSGGSSPKASTCSQVISSSVAIVPSNSGLWPLIDQMAQASVQMSLEKERGMSGSNLVSGGRIDIGV